LLKLIGKCFFIDIEIENYFFFSIKY
jgi:hypothetical protein